MGKGTYGGGIRGGKTDVGHDGDHHMFLHVEPSGIKAPGTSKSGKLASRKDILKEFTDRESAICDYPSVVIHGGLKWTKPTATGRR